MITPGSIGNLPYMTAPVNTSQAMPAAYGASGISMPMMGQGVNPMLGGLPTANNFGGGIAGLPMQGAGLSMTFQDMGIPDAVLQVALSRLASNQAEMFNNLQAQKFQILNGLASLPADRQMMATQLFNQAKQLQAQMIQPIIASAMSNTSNNWASSNSLAQITMPSYTPAPVQAQLPMNFADMGIADAVLQPALSRLKPQEAQLFNNLQMQKLQIANALSSLPGDRQMMAMQLFNQARNLQFNMVSPYLSKGNTSAASNPLAGLLGLLGGSSGGSRSSGGSSSGGSTTTTPDNFMGSDNVDDIFNTNRANSTLTGLSGNDTYRLGASANNVLINEVAGGGTDTVEAEVSVTLADNIERLLLQGLSNLTGTGNNQANEMIGNSGNNLLQGLAGNDTLNGGTGADTLDGGQGNDIFVVNSADDVVIELANQGIDMIQAFLNWTLSDNVEGLTLMGTDNLNATGNNLNNTLLGNAGNNVFNGGLGNDTMTGGAGDDTYTVDAAGDQTIELLDGGTDTVQASLNWTLAQHVENLILTGNALMGTGNALNNTITGNEQNNTLNGGVGADTMSGGLGDDTYIVDNTGDFIQELSNQGSDTVQASVNYTLGAYIENLVLTGSSALEGIGNTLNNIITGNTGNNTLNGGTGEDTFIGGAGNDTYIINSAGDVVTETADGGNDTIQSSISTILGQFIENLTLTGNANLNATGNELNNNLIGNDGNNLIDGGTGNDTMAGGLGNDTYVIDAQGDVVTENDNSGVDTIQSGISYTLGANLENLILTGSANLNATGNTLANQLTGNTGNNLIDAGAGNDTLNGGGGNDTLLGGEGNDTYEIGSTGDIVINESDATADQDTVNFGAYTKASVKAALVGSNDLQLTLSDNRTVTIKNFFGANTQTAGSGFINTLQFGDGALSLTDIQAKLTEALTLNGTEGDDVLNGQLGNDTINGNGGNDRLDGREGNDNISGGNGNDTLNGGSGNDTLNGGSGNDVMAGGQGNDTYVVDSDSDSISEAADEGTDTVNSSVNHTLAANVENLNLTGNDNLSGTGNSQNNVINGNNGNNTLDGGSGADTLRGGSGDDTYAVDNASDSVVENEDQGTDTVNSSVNHTLGNNVENLTLTGNANLSGTGNSDANTITGNSGDNQLSGAGGNDTLDGGQGNDTLDGGSGDDVMAGGDGNDTYVVDSVSDQITDTAGKNSVQASVSFSLVGFDAFDNLTLTGTNNIDGTGNNDANTITGNDGNNLINGGAGHDTLISGAGQDTLIGGEGNDVFKVSNQSGNVTIEANTADNDQAELAVDVPANGNFQAIDTDNDGNFDALEVKLNDDRKVTFKGYFDNTTAILADLTAGSGVASIQFNNQANPFNFNNIKDLLNPPTP